MSGAMTPLSTHRLAGRGSMASAAAPGGAGTARSAFQSRECRSLTHALPDSHGSGQVSDVVWAGVRAETRGILAGWGAEQAAVFAVELRGAVVADEMSDAGDVAGA